MRSWILTGVSFIGETLIILVPFLIQEHFQKYGTPSPTPLQFHIHSFSDLFDYTLNK